MIEIDLLKLDLAPHYEVMAGTVGRPDVDLHFNGRLVWGDIINAIVAGRRDIAAFHELPVGYVTPSNLDIALYHPEEKALYVAVDYVLPGKNSRGDPLLARAERKITCGPEVQSVVISDVSVGTTVKMLELMDVIDLSRVMWLPLRT